MHKLLNAVKYKSAPEIVNLNIEPSKRSNSFYDGYLSSMEIDKLFSEEIEEEFKYLLAILSTEAFSYDFFDKIVKTGGRSAKAALAINPFIDEESQNSLASHGCSEIRAALAENPNLLYSQQVYLHETSNDDIKVSLAKNFNISESLQEMMIQDCREVRCALASNSSLKSVHQEYLAEDNIDVRVALASNSSLSFDMQKKLAEGDWRVRESLARNNSLFQEIIEKLANDDDNDVLTALSSNETLTEKVQAFLIFNASNDAKLKLASNKSLAPAQQLEILKSDNNDILIALYYNPSVIDNVKSKISEKLSLHELEILKSELNNLRNKLVRHNQEMWDTFQKYIDASCSSSIFMTKSRIEKLKSEHYYAEAQYNLVNSQVHIMEEKINSYKEILSLKQKE